MIAGTASLSMLEAAVPELKKMGLEEVELFSKHGRSRRFERGMGHVASEWHRERGWAVRATGSRASLLTCGTGAITKTWPEPDGYPLALPAGGETVDWKEPKDLDAPLAVEAEAIALFETCARELHAELPGARLLRAVLEDGASEVGIASTRGIRADYRNRTATLFLEVLEPEPGLQTVCELFAEREARRFRPQALVRRLADHLVLKREGVSVERDRGEFLLGPSVGVRILEGLQPLLVGAPAVSRARELGDRAGRLASSALTIVDDGGLEGGLLSAPADGEGVPTRRTMLVERGLFRRPLTAWFEEQVVPRSRIVGCVRRAGWRDLPRVGPSHMFIQPRSETSVASLLGSLARGYYFTEVASAGTFDLLDNRFRVQVRGFEVQSGRVVRRVGRAVLAGRVTALLQGIQGVGRDLTFFPRGSMLGSPSLLVGGLELDDS